MKRPLHRIVLWAVLVGVTPMIAGCADFDLDKLDVLGLNEKKKLPGERHDVFPGGVPGVSQGIPPEYLKKNEGIDPNAGYTVPPEPRNAAAAAEQQATESGAAEPEKPKAAAKPKPKRAAKSKPKPTPVSATPAEPAQAQPAAQAAPASSSTSGWPAQSQSSTPAAGSAWPAPQPSGTFQR